MRPSQIAAHASSSLKHHCGRLRPRIGCLKRWRDLNYRQLALLVATCILAMGSATSTTVQAQEPEPPWRAIENLTADVDASAFRPSMAADPAGNLHVVWPGHSDPENASGSFAANSVFYTYWDGTQWAPPIDVAYDSVSANNPKIYIDEDWVLHVYWVGSRSINHSWAPAEQAYSASNWRTEPVVPAGNFAIAAESNGKIHLVYAQEQINLYYTRSDDSGQSWSEPQLITTVGDADKVAINVVTAAVDQTGRVHVSWNENTQARGWSPESVWYLHSLDAEGVQWSDPVLVDTDPDSLRYAATEPQLAVAPDGVIHLLWHRGVSYDDGRFHIWSSDGGETWSEVKPSFPGYKGSTGNDSIVFDSAGLMHLLMSAAPSDGTSRMYHSTWQDGAWTRLEFIAFAEHPSAAISEGNLLHLVMHWQGQNDIGYTWRTVDASHVAPQEQPVRPTPALQPDPTPVVSDTVLAPTPVPVRASTFDEHNPQKNASVISPLLAGTLPAILLVATVMIAAVGRRRH